MTRPRFLAFLPVLLLAAGCTVPGDPAATGPVTTPTTAPPTATTAPPAATVLPGNVSSLPQAEVLAVYDGDTLLVSLDGAEEEVRLLGINAPESDECFGGEARDALSALVDAGPLRLDVERERDQYGRLLAHAYAGETFVNPTLIEQGFALALHEDHARADEFLHAGEDAFAAGRGMWAPTACGPAPGAVIRLLEIEANPPGPDEDDLNGEWVRLDNRGEAGADLTGWVLRDESSANRYEFPDGTRLAAGAELAVHTGCGADGGGRLYWCRNVPVWNNGGDTALLLDPHGNVAARLTYP